MLKMMNAINRMQSLVAVMKSNRGITLIELMIVITIVGILSLIVVPKFMDLPKKARIESARQTIASFGTALDRYYLDNGVYPTTEQGLHALVNKPTTEPIPQNFNSGGYLKKKEIPKDPWGREYIYKCPGESGNDYEIMSLGADGAPGGDGENKDIKSWE